MTLAILLIIAFFAAAFWIIPDRASSEEENRVLAQFPEFSPESLESGKFTSDFASYMADQFPMRDTFVGIKAAAEISMLKLENNSVMLAPGDTLAERFDTVNTDNVKVNTDAIYAFCGTLNSRGITARFALLPRSMDIFDIPLYGRGRVRERMAKRARYRRRRHDRYAQRIRRAQRRIPSTTARITTTRRSARTTHMLRSATASATRRTPLSITNARRRPTPSSARPTQNPE